MIIIKKYEAWMVGCDCCDGVMVASAESLIEGSVDPMFIAFENKSDALKNSVHYGLNKIKKVTISYEFDDSIHSNGDHDKILDRTL